MLPGDPLEGRPYTTELLLSAQMVENMQNILFLVTFSNALLEKNLDYFLKGGSTLKRQEITLCP